MGEIVSLADVVQEVFREMVAFELIIKWDLRGKKTNFFFLMWGTNMAKAWRYERIKCAWSIYTKQLACSGYFELLVMESRR